MEAESKHQYGRKVLFVNATTSIVHTLIPALIDAEFDASYIADAKCAIDVVAEFSGAIVVVNVEQENGSRKWVKLINQFGDDGSSDEISVCVMYKGAFDEAAFAQDAHFAGGFIKLPEVGNDIAPLMERLDALNAKGLRKFVRADCTNDDSATMLANVNNKLYKMKLLDISLAGCAATVEAEYGDAFPVKSVVQSTTITLKRKSISWPAVVFASLPGGGTHKVVLMFMKGIPKETGDVIHEYIMQSGQNAVDAVEQLVAVKVATGT